MNIDESGDRSGHESRDKGNDKSGENRTSRLFFAIWPDEQLQGQLLQWQRLLVTTGKPVPKERLHLTLAFLGDTAKETEDLLIRKAKALCHPSFEFTLDQIGYFKRPQIAWLGSSKVPNPLSLLHQKLSEIIKDCGLPPPEESFKPHVTLARKTQRPVEPSVPPHLIWRVSEFCLVQSRQTEQGPEYRSVGVFPMFSQGSTRK